MPCISYFALIHMYTNIKIKPSCCLSEMKCYDPCCTRKPQQSLQQFKVQSDFWKNILHQTAVPEDIKVNAGKTLLAWTVCTF